jgi:hypothetical protein
MDGFCECGCGQRTKISPKSDAPKGYVKGEPRRFIRGHSTRIVGKRWTLDERSYTVEDRGYETPCWIWKGKPNQDGYGIYSRADGGTTLAHRRMWEHLHDSIPAGLQIDHLCRVRICVNPSHMELVTLQENIKRGQVVKIPAETIDAIRCSAESSGILALRHGIHPGTVWRIRTGRSRV